MVNKSKFIKLVKERRSKLEKAVTEILDRGDFISQVSEEWRVRDVIAHIVWYEKEMLHLIREKNMMRNAEIWNNDTDVRNKLVYNITKDWSDDEILTKFNQIGVELVELLEQIDQEMYDNPQLYDGMPTDWTPKLVFSGNTYKHYPEHLSSLKEKFEYLD